MTARLEVERVRASHRGVALLEHAPLPWCDLQLEKARHRLDDSLLQREGLEGVILGRQAAQDARARPVHEPRVEAQAVAEARETRGHDQRRAEVRRAASAVVTPAWRTSLAGTTDRPAW